MNNATLQSLMSVNALLINAAQGEVSSYKRDARFYNAIGEKAFAVDSYKECDRYRVILAKRVANQVAMKAEMAYNNSLVRIDSKKSKLFGADNSVAYAPNHTADEIESSLDEAIAIKFPKKADTRPADHPSLQKAA